MPNWCSTYYKCVGDEDEIYSLYDTLKKVYPESGPWKDNWLGLLIAELGGDPAQYDCRSFLLSYKVDDDNVLYIDQETAWCERSGVREFIEQTFPSIKVYYLEEECGCEVYATNDSDGIYFPERYCVYGCNMDEHFTTIEDAAQYVSEIVGSPVEPNAMAIAKALAEYMRNLNDEDAEDEWYTFREIDIV